VVNSWGGANRESSTEYYTVCLSLMVTLLQEINTPLSRSQLDELLDMLDKDGDGEIDLK